MSYWQVTFRSASGQVMTLGVRAADADSALRQALPRSPFKPGTCSLAEIPPLCTAHSVRHECFFEQEFE